MKKRSSGEKISEWFNRQPVWILITLFLVAFTFLGAINTISQELLSTYRTHIGWKNVEQKKIDQLSPLETLDYFNKVLGQPILKEPAKNGSRFDKLIYKERGYWVAAYVDLFNTVQAVAITGCGENNFYPIIRNNPLGHSIILSRDVMENGATPKINIREVFLDR